MTFIDYGSRDALMTGLADRIAGSLRAGVEAKGFASLAVPGGSTPGPMFDALAQRDLPWSQIHVLLSDERRVPADHERSNERLLRARLLTGHARAARYFSIRPDAGSDPAAEIAGLLPLSVVLLGMGSDMHTASIFPGSDDLEVALSKTAPPLLNVAASDGLEPRITLSGPTLAAAEECHILITGDEKRAALERAKTLPPHEAPIKVVLDQATVHWAA